MLLPLFPATTLMAATITVTSVSGSCDLSSAIDSANANVALGGCTAGEGSPVVDRIVFAESLSGQTLTHPFRYSLDSDLEIDGNSSITLSRQDLAGPTYRIFEISSGSTVILRGLTIKDAAVSGGSEYGGAIENFGHLTIDSCVISGNEASADGGAIASYGSGSLTLLNSIVENNSSGIWGGAIVNWGGDLVIENSHFFANTATGDGGAIFVAGGTATITDSFFTGNTSGNFGGGIYNRASLAIAGTSFSGNTANNGGGIHNAAAMTIESSTLFENVAASGGGIGHAGNSSSMTVSNSTISGNTATGIGGGILMSSSFSDGISISHSTIVGNTAGFAGFFAGLSSSVRNGTLANTVIADNLADGQPADCSILFDWARRSNWSGDGTCGGVLSGDPGLGPLADNGGGIKTHLPLAGSGLLDAANLADCSQSDQRGVARPQDSLGGAGTSCDIGAVERLAAPVSSCAAGDVIVLPDMLNGTDQQFSSEAGLSTAGAVELVNGANLSLTAAQNLGLARGFTVQTGGELSLEVAAVNCN